MSSVLFGLMKFLTWLVSPLAVGLCAALSAGIAFTRCARRWGWGFLTFALLWLIIWSSPWFYFIFGGALEAAYPPKEARELPKADVIVVLGGGVGARNAQTHYPELFAAADRGWHAARCYHAGRAPRILCSGIGEEFGTKRFLMDLGVPAKQITVESKSRNTFENSSFTREKLVELKARKVILVTSAWHMRRSVMTFERMGMEVIPAATDYEALNLKRVITHRDLAFYLPNPETLNKTGMMFKEHLGYWAYWLWLKCRH